MAKMHINSNDAYFIATAITSVVGFGAMDSGRTMPIFRKLKR